MKTNKSNKRLSFSRDDSTLTGFGESYQNSQSTSTQKSASDFLLGGAQ
jgi:hypothetical protein